MRRHLIFLFVFFIALVAKAQVWTLDKNQFYILGSYSSAIYMQAFDSTGAITDLTREVTDLTIQLHAEYGVTGRLTIHVTVPYKMVSTDASVSLDLSDPENLPAGTMNHFGNIEAGGIYKIVQDKPQLTGSLFISANTQDYNFINGLQTGYNSWGFRPGLGVAWSFSQSWLSFYTGGDIRTNHYSSAIIAAMEGGYKPVKFIMIAGRLDLRKPIGNGDYNDCNISKTALYLDNQEYLAAGIKAGYIIKEKWGVNFGYNIPLSGKNSLADDIITVGLSYKDKF